MTVIELIEKLQHCKYPDREIHVVYNGNERNNNILEFTEVPDPYGANSSKSTLNIIAWG